MIVQRNNELLPCVFQFLQILAQRVKKLFSSIANKFYPLLLLYLSNSDQRYINECHCLLKQMVYVCNDSPQFLLAILPVVKSAKKGDVIISCIIDYLHFISYYKEAVLLEMKDVVIEILQQVKAKCLKEEKSQVKHLSQKYFSNATNE